MAEPAAPASSGDVIDYRPLSGYALAGFIVSVVFALLVVVTTLIALAQGLPFFFPFWVVLLAAVGLVLSLLGQQQVRNSEGTRAGLALARAGFWTSLFTGLGYFAYYYVTGLAVTSQANHFLLVNDSPTNGFFARLEKQDDPVELRSAYLFTLPANQRGGAKPQDAAAMAVVHDQPGRDGSPGRLTAFARSLLVRAFHKGTLGLGPAVIEPLGVHSWGFESNSYKVARNYRLRSPEVEMEFLIPVQSTEGDAAGQMREWFVSFNAVQMDPAKRKFTALGDGIRELRNQATLKVFDLAQRYAKALPCPEFRPEDTDWDALIPVAEPRAEVKQIISDLFQGKPQARAQIFPPPHDNIGDWDKTRDGKVRFYTHMTMHLAHNAPFVGGMADILVETTSHQSLSASDIAAPTKTDWGISAVRIERVALNEAAAGQGQKSPPAGKTPPRKPR